MAKSITILGSTGSIGVSSLRVAEFLKKDYYVYGLACQSNIELLEKQIIDFQPRVAAVKCDETIESKQYKELKSRFNNVEFLEGDEGVIELARRSVDILVSAIVGAAGLKPTLEAIKSVKRIALANKETLVMAGDHVMSEISKNDVELVPVDSEHSAIYSLLNGHSIDDIERIILTASGGSLREIPVEQFDSVTPEIALNHPTWDMGNKITIDSATLMNKGFEVIEAKHLFNIGYDKIDIIIHPESIIHSMIESVDGSIYAHMGVADMALPILNAFKHPVKMKNNFGRLKLEELGSLNFSAFDSKKYPALELCYYAGKCSGTMPAVLNASNEVAVNAFLNKKILFTDIVKIVEKTMEQHNNIINPDIDCILDTDKNTREITNSFIKRYI